MITQLELKESLAYNPDTGDFTWVKGRRKGQTAGYTNATGYVDVRLKGKTYKAHRLAFVHEGVDLPRCIDHIDGNRSNNRWDNLRPATHQQNACNRKQHKNNRSGSKGVRYCPYYECWIVKVTVNGRHHEDFADDYHSAVALASGMRKQLHGEFARDC